METQPLLTEPTHQQRKLLDKHIIMIAIGGTIGTGVFLGSGATIAIAGPIGALLGYLLVSIMVYCIMTSLGELATFYPISGSFCTYAGRYVDDALAAAIGWSYWLQWAISFPSEVSAGGIILSFWFPNIKPIFGTLSILLTLVFINLRGVEGFGETEYWLSSIKIVTIISFIVVGVFVDLGVLGDDYIGTKYWFVDGAPFKNGISGVFNVFLSIQVLIVVAFFSFGGSELIGITAGETVDPQRTVPKAIKSTFIRILLFYISTILIMGLTIDNKDPNLIDAGTSNDIQIAPFTLVFEKAGLRMAATVMNGVLLSAVLSAGNSALFAASRTLFAMANEGKAPAFFSKLSTNGVPVNSILVTAVIGCLALAGELVGNSTVFMTLVSVTGVLSIITWMTISVIHIRFRQAFKAQNKSIDELKYKSPFYPVGPILGITLGSIIIVGQGMMVSSASRLLLVYAGIPLFLGIYVGYKIKHKSTLIPLLDVDLTEFQPE